MSASLYDTGNRMKSLLNGCREIFQDDSKKMNHITAMDNIHRRSVEIGSQKKDSVSGAFDAEAASMKHFITEARKFFQDNTVLAAIHGKNPALGQAIQQTLSQEVSPARSPATTSAPSLTGSPL